MAGFLLGGIGSLVSGVTGTIAANHAANLQAQSAANALGFQKQVFDTQQQNASPYLAAGSTSVGALMKDLGNGTFGPGSIPSFSAPSLDQARSTPGYQFTADQGNNAIARSAAATGGELSGGTLKALDSYNTGLADSTYNDVFSRSLNTYNANLQGQAQQFQQLFAPSQLGANVAAGINNTDTQMSTNIGQQMNNIGGAQAAGTVGVANSLGAGITGATNAYTGSQLYNMLLANPGGGGGGSSLLGASYNNPTGVSNPDGVGIADPGSLKTAADQYIGLGAG